MFHIPTVDEWWQLTEKYPQFRVPSHTALKDYGYMMLFEAIEKHRPQRILEFGHGFNATLFEYCEARGIEGWGVDDHMSLPYFPPLEQWEASYKSSLIDRLSKTRLIRGQIGTRMATRDVLPKGYFDIVCSISVLEEIGERATIVSILQHAYELLAPGGLLVNTHDVVFGDPTRPALLLDCLNEAGFTAGLTEQETAILRDPAEYVRWAKVLLENPTLAMIAYNTGGAERRYSGHWSTLFSSVRK